MPLILLFNIHSLLNMFRPLIRPSSGVCDFLVFISCVVSGLVCVGVPFQCGYGGVVSLCSLKPKHVE